MLLCHDARLAADCSVFSHSLSSSCEGALAVKLPFDDDENSARTDSRDEAPLSRHPSRLP
jgi:hypothetical protein